MKVELWYLALGALPVVIALVGSLVKRLPLTTTILYGVGVLLGPLGFKMALFDPHKHVIVSRIFRHAPFQPAFAPP
jgi:hypothetical protein